jgi:hypothetical protein
LVSSLLRILEIQHSSLLKRNPVETSFPDSRTFSTFLPGIAPNHGAHEAIS